MAHEPYSMATPLRVLCLIRPDFRQSIQQSRPFIPAHPHLACCILNPSVGCAQHPLLPIQPFPHNRRTAMRGWRVRSAQDRNMMAAFKLVRRQLSHVACVCGRRRLPSLAPPEVAPQESWWDILTIAAQIALDFKRIPAGIRC
eukprot:94353-Chlamydomonas_euryale.AAC.2